MDSFFKQRFNASKCKTLLKLSIPRIKLLRNRRENQIKQMRKEIAKLLETGQEATARIRVEHIIREEKMMAAQEIVELFCELIAVRLPIIEAQKECPLDLKEAISSVCFAAPRCADLTELLQVQLLFSAKYGKEFIAAATELMSDCGVNRQLVEFLSVRVPAPDVKLKLLKEIAEEHGLDWDPSASEHELLKKHEDLLSGPTQFSSGFALPLPKEKYEEATHAGEKHEETAKVSTSEAAANESSLEDDFDIIDFPEVPNVPLNTNKGNNSTPEMLPFPASALSEDDNDDFNPTAPDNIRSIPTEHETFEKPIGKEYASSKVVANPSGEKQSVPFNAQSQSSVPEEKRYNSTTPFVPQSTVDLQDVLAAAQAAAETAERAAAAARSAASIAQLRISDLVNRKSNEVPTTFPKDGDSVTPQINLSLGGDGHQTVVQPSYYDPHSTENYSPSPTEKSSTDHHPPERLPSMDDESYFSYPNLFSPHGADLANRT